MKPRHLSFVVLPLLIVSVLFYQNCDGGFAFNKQSGFLTSLDEGDLKVSLYDSTGRRLTETEDLETGKAYKITVDGQDLAFRTAVAWDLSAKVTGSFRLLSMEADLDRQLFCDAEGDLILTVRVLLSTNKELYGTIRRECVRGPDGPYDPNTTPTPTPTPDPVDDLVTFRIPAGTGSNPWNTLGTAVRVFVGQTLRIVNDDSVAHKLYTPGSPCAPQAQNSEPGGTYDCAISSAETASEGRLYDELAGVNAKFYVNAINGNQLYASTCAGCHGPIASSTKRFRPSAAIRAATQTIDAMKPVNLTDDQIAAIAYSLSR